MNSWIDLNALWKIVVFGLLAGAGLPAIFSIGLFSLSRGPKLQRAGAEGGDSDAIVGGSVVGMVIAAICCLIVLAAIGWGVYEIYVTGHPKK
jgi:formate hydrogenlyase subunit 3/multisubunit Na+/H+ antiporter MnhD subunit